jgi:hypothetical protein
MAVVARLLRGEPLEVVAREANVSVAKLTEWRDAKIEVESADTLAPAAFDKCVAQWSSATEKMIAARTPHFSAEEMKKIHFLLSETIETITRTSEENSVAAWRESEIRRLRVVILDARMNATPH